jgi:hypothetical protein
VSYTFDNPQHEHEFEAAHGLPEALPDGEYILWQGQPEWKSLARTAFHVRQVIAYFAVILALRGIFAYGDDGSVIGAVLSALWLLPLAMIAVGILATMAWCSAKTSAYTVTNKRIIMRVGIVLNVTFNIPFRSIEAAGLRQFTDGSGDIPLQLIRGEHIAYLHLWPHVRPWEVARTQPMMRSVANVARLGTLLADAMAASSASRAKSTLERGDLVRGGPTADALSFHDMAHTN